MLSTSKYWAKLACLKNRQLILKTKLALLAVAPLMIAFGASIRIDGLRPWKRWALTVRMLAIAMPLTILAVALLGVALGGLTLAGAILLGAVFAPTDPVLTAEVQVGPPQEGQEHPVLVALTTKASLNDGLAFPSVNLGLIVAASVRP